jgi:hypothetical protein
LPRITWGGPGTSRYESGVDRGVLYVTGQPGVPWNGLTSVSEAPSGGDAKAYYVDGVKYLNLPSAEEFEATLTAFTYPDEFAECDGSHQPRAGLFVTSQKRKPFGLTYRTTIGTDQEDEHAHKIHIVYNALVSPTNRDRKTRTDTGSLDDFSWKITACPPPITGYFPTAHFIVDTRFTDISVVEAIENKLYGTDTDDPALPTVDELLGFYDTISGLVITDNGDGTWTATAPNDVIRMLDDTTFEITSSTATFVDADSYTISSS